MQSRAQTLPNETLSPAPIDAALREAFRDRLEAEAHDLQQRHGILPERDGQADSETLIDLDAERDVEIVLDQATEATLVAIREALARLDDGTFGRCVDCHDLIPIDRLRALPYAPRCLPCQGRAERRR